MKLHLLFYTFTFRKYFLSYFSLLPLGQRVIERLTRLIDIELETLGAMKISVPILGSRALWEKTARWENMGSELFKVRDRHEAEMCLQVFFVVLDVTFHH